MTEDDIYLSVMAPKQYKEHKNKLKSIAKQAHIDSKPDFSQSDLAPMEIRKVRFDHTAIDYSRDKQNKTEDELFDEIMNPQHKVKVTNTQDSPEVANYFSSVVQKSIIKRGKAYKKILG